MSGVRGALRDAVVCGLLYLLAVVGVAVLEHRSEMSKLDRGAYTDTFEPTISTQLVTLPLSLRVDDDLVGYPDEFDAEVYRDVVRVRLETLVLAGVVQAGLLAVLVAGLLLLRERTRPGPRSERRPGAT